MSSDSPPPTKAGLLKWWTQFTHTQNRKKDFDQTKATRHPIFKKPLKESLRYASVQIAAANANGEQYVWGYFPVVVAKCGLYLKENATEVEGTFSVDGSTKRMQDLQAVFETSPQYGKSLDWKKEIFTTHDVAIVFRRYLTQMPEPVIPHDMYHDFRDVLVKKPFNQDEVIATYKRLIKRMPRANQYLLFYVLDLLSIFARKSDKNLLTATSLAMIFRPSLISHPNHEMSPGEHALSQRVLEFLIAQQDWFLLDMQPPPRSEPSSSWKPPPQLPQHARTQKPSEDLIVVSSSDDEPNTLNGGWKLVGRDRRRIQRRRTTLEHTDSLDKADNLNDEQMSPVVETPGSRPVGQVSGPGAVGVSRSRMLPSSSGTSTDDEQERRALYTRNGDIALSSKDYDKAIKLYSAAIDLDSASDTIFASRCNAKLRKMLWEDALVDAQKVIEINPSSYIGYELKNEALHGLQRYDEAIIALDIMLSKLNHISNTHMQELRQQYVTLSEAANIIQEVIRAQLEDAPHRLINTITGRLCNRGEQIIAFKTGPKYKELLSSTMKHAGADLQMQDITNVVEMYFRCVMLSHRWEEVEPPLRHIQDKNVYKLDPVGGVTKLQSFCKTARDAGYYWAWVDTCCIDQTNNVEVQQSVNSMFVWYRHSALTIVYLSDVPSSSKPGALARSVWNKRGWTVQEFLAPKFVLFYQSDWTLYLNDQSPNHKDSAVIIQELGDATGIDPQALVAFRPGMRGAREKLQWVSTRITTLQEDIAYSLFGIFGIHLPVIYGENKQNALGRLLQEIIAKSGDITCLDWVGKPSEFNSCLPASITSYGAPPSALLSPISEDEMQTSVSSLRDAVDAELASKLYQRFESLNSPQFTASRLRLPCIAFAVTSVGRRRGEDQQSAPTFVVKAAGLRDLLITTEDRLIHLLRARPSWQSFLLVHPWDRSLLELHDFAELPDLSDMKSISEDWSPPASPLPYWRSLGENGPVDSESYSRALRLIVRLGQPFSAFLLVQQPGGEYKRFASDQNIIAQVKDMTTIRDTMDIRTLEIL